MAAGSFGELMATNLGSHINRCQQLRIAAPVLPEFGAAYLFQCHQHDINS